LVASGVLLLAMFAVAVQPVYAAGIVVDTLADAGHEPVADADREPGSLLWALVAPVSMLIASVVVAVILRRRRSE
jgi:hypothetical protein